MIVDVCNKSVEGGRGSIESNDATIDRALAHSQRGFVCKIVIHGEESVKISRVLVIVIQDFVQRSSSLFSSLFLILTILSPFIPFSPFFLLRFFLQFSSCFFLELNIARARTISIVRVNSWKELETY